MTYFTKMFTKKNLGNISSNPIAMLISDLYNLQLHINHNLHF